MRRRASCRIRHPGEGASPRIPASSIAGLVHQRGETPRPAPAGLSRGAPDVDHHRSRIRGDRREEHVLRRVVAVVVLVFAVIGTGLPAARAAERHPVPRPEPCLNLVTCGPGTLPPGTVDPGPKPRHPSLPAPEVVFTAREAYSTGAGRFVRHDLDVVNWQSYDPQLFDEAPHLPRRAGSRDGSRPSVGASPRRPGRGQHFHDADSGRRIHGHCAIGGPEGLRTVHFPIRSRGIGPLSRSTCPSPTVRRGEPSGSPGQGPGTGDGSLPRGRERQHRLPLLATGAGPSTTCSRTASWPSGSSMAWPDHGVRSAAAPAQGERTGQLPVLVDQRIRPLVRWTGSATTTTSRTPRPTSSAPP